MIIYEGMIQFKNTKKTVMKTYMYLLLSRLHMAQDKFCHFLVYIVNVKNITKRYTYSAGAQSDYFLTVSLEFCDGQYCFKIKPV